MGLTSLGFLLLCTQWHLSARISNVVSTQLRALVRLKIVIEGSLQLQLKLGLIGFIDSLMHVRRLEWNIVKVYV